MYNHKRLESGKARTQSPCGICKPCKIEGSRHQTLLCQMLLGARGNTSVGQITGPTRISKTHAQQDSAQTLWYAKCSGPNHLCNTKQNKTRAHHIHNAVNITGTPGSFLLLEFRDLECFPQSVFALLNCLRVCRVLV